MNDKMTKTRIEMGETAATIICDKDYLDDAIDGIAKARAEIKSYARDRQEFILSLEPVACDKCAPKTVRRMCEAASMVGVGPMAAVAGAIALAGVESAAEKGATHCIIDNGGDIAMLLDREITVGILEDLGLEELPAIRLRPTNGRIIGVCTSSGIFGHSISFGMAKAATVMAMDPVLADAAATALANECKSARHVEGALRSLSQIDGIIWAMAIVESTIGTLGSVPGMTFAKASKGAVTVHSKFPPSAYLT